LEIIRNWCCQTGLNCRPLHYQWSALPLSYGSMPRIRESAKRGPPTRRPILATRAPYAQARGRPARASKSDKISSESRPTAPGGSVGRSGSPFSSATGPKSRPGIGDCTNGERNTICSPGHMSRFTMQDGNDKDDRQTGSSAKNPRADRLKLALRENLKRRKSQARARSDVATASSDRDDATPHDGSGKKPGE
jgi:hypothetical protein